MRPRRKTFRIRLPELSPREATALSYMLDQLDNALWLAYGPQMLAICERGGIPRIVTVNERAQLSDNERER